LMSPPPALLSPAIAWRVWRGNRRAAAVTSSAVEATAS